MDENFIIVENVIEKDLLKVIVDFTNKYSDNVFVEGIQFYKNKGTSNSFIVRFTNQPDLEIFCYLVNYIKYPEGFRRFSPFLRGYTTLDFKTEKYKPSAGSRKMVYISRDDRDYDNVNFVTDKNETYVFNFSGKTKKIEYSEISFDLKLFKETDYVLVQTISPTIIRKKENKDQKKGKRKGKDFSVMMGCLGFTVIGLFVKMNGEEEAWGGIIFFGFGFLFMLAKLIFPEKFEKPLFGNKKGNK